MTHDPLCPTAKIKNKNVTYEFGSCSCDLIARVRQDDQAKFDDWFDNRAIIYQEIGYSCALRDAANLVQKIFSEHPLEFPTDYASLIAEEINALRKPLPASDWTTSSSSKTLTTRASVGSDE